MATNQNLQNIINQALADWKTQASEGIQQPDFNDISTALDEYYFIMKLKTYCAYLSYRHIAQRDKANTQQEDFRFIRTILQQGKEIIAENPLFKLYNQIRVLYERLNEDSAAIEELFLTAQKDIYAYAKLLEQEEVLELYSFLTNFCVKKSNLGKVVYRERLFLVYNDLLNLKYYGQRGRQSPLPPQIYKNMVTYAILLQKNPLFKKLQTVGLPTDNSKGFKNGFIWAERFVDIYKSKLDKKFRSIYPAYCAALLSFKQNTFLKAYQQLGNPTYVKGKYMPFDVKTLQLRILYEVQLIDPEKLEKDGVEIKKIMDAFRKKIAFERDVTQQLKYQLQQYIDFEICFKTLMKFHTNYFGRLLKSNNPKYQSDKAHLESLIKACLGPYQGWFREKMNNV